MIAMKRDLPSESELRECQQELIDIVVRYELSEKEEGRMLRYIRSHFNEWFAALEANDYLNHQDKIALKKRR